MITYDQLCKQLADEVKSLSKEELESKITAWLLNSELEIYVPVLQKELKKRLAISKIDSSPPKTVTLMKLLPQKQVIVMML